MYLEELVQISDKLSAETLNTASHEQNAENIIEETERSLFNLAEGEFSQSFIPFTKALDQTIEMATIAMQNDQGLLSANWFKRFGPKTGGLHKSGWLS